MLSEFDGDLAQRCFFGKFFLDHDTVIDGKSCIIRHDNSFPEARPGQDNYTIKRGRERSSWQIRNTKGVDGVDKSRTEDLLTDTFRRTYPLNPHHCDGCISIELSYLF